MSVVKRLVGTLWRSGAQGDEKVLFGRNGDSFCCPRSVDADTVYRYRV